MQETLSTQIEALKETPIHELQKQYKELFKGEGITALQKTYLQRKIAYKLQESLDAADYPLKPNSG